MKAQMIRIGNFFFHYRNKAFPIIMIALFALATPLTTLFGSELLAQICDIFAIIVALSGLALRGLVIGYAYIKRGGMNKKVYAENLVTQGVFGICRNPLYVGNMLIYVGVFIMHRDPLVMILGIGFYLFIYQCIILAEEAYLENKFGSGYNDYCNDVPRWIPRFSKLKEATEGMEFNAKRVIVKDYTTMATTLFTLSVVELYEQLAAYGMKDITSPYPMFLIAAMVTIGITTLSIRVLKKRKIISEHAA